MASEHKPSVLQSTAFRAESTTFDPDASLKIIVSPSEEVRTLDAAVGPGQ
jgi:hypothetical protein